MQFSECCEPLWLVSKPRGVAVVGAYAINYTKVDRKYKCSGEPDWVTKDSPVEGVVLFLWSLSLVPGGCYLTPSIYICCLC